MQSRLPPYVWLSMVSCEPEHYRKPRFYQVLLFFSDLLRFTVLDWDFICFNTLKDSLMMRLFLSFIFLTKS